MRKIILVTGASSGIGKATALQLIKEGHMVYGAARRTEHMRDIEEAGGRALQMDIMSEEDVQRIVQTIISEQGTIDVLVNNAGYAVYGPVEEVSIEDARRQFEVNIFGLARLTQLVIPYMREHHEGTIVNISSMGGKIYTPLGAWYHATKHALEGWSDCLRLELEPFGIDVVIIEPGLIITGFGDVMYDSMVERSKGGVYEPMSNAIAQATKSTYETEGAGSPPSVIAMLISKAIRSNKPKTRYAAGKMSKLLLFMRRWLSDRMFDKTVMSQVRS